MLFDSEKLLLIAGPCSLESMDVCRPVAEQLSDFSKKNDDLEIVFKGSFDKANRTSIGSGRGTGLRTGIEILAEIKARYGLPVLTDIHEISQIERVAEVVDVLQIPAFLCRQTDLLVTAAKTTKAVNVKKGQFLAPGDVRYVVEKLEQAGASEIWITERGTTFGYQNLVVDMRGFPIMAKTGHPVIFDATHSVQLPGAGDGKSDGQREFVLPLARASIAAGASGVFLETHPNPENAVSDGPNMVPLERLKGVVSQILQIWRLMNSLATG